MQILTDRAERTIRRALESARSVIQRPQRDEHRDAALTDIHDAFAALNVGAERLEVELNVRG